MSLRAIADALLSSLFEPPCAACARVLSHPLNGAVCAPCWASLRRGAPLNEHLNGRRGVDWVCAVGHYEGRLRDIIHAMKYERRRSIASPLGALMRASGAPLLCDADVAVPVPLHPRRERVRGFNQADDLARQLGLPVASLLQRVRDTRSQIDLPAEDRQRNVGGAFVMAEPPRPATAGPHIPVVVVLVDDVSTTGATLDACARVLKTAGVREVRALTAARVVTGRR